MIIVDTNVVSELMKSSPSEPVIEWVRARTGSELFTTSITLAEILYGIAQLPDAPPHGTPARGGASPRGGVVQPQARPRSIRWFPRFLPIIDGIYG